MQAIVTRYHGPGNVRGSRVKATASAGSVSLQWEGHLNSEGNHIAAAKALATKFGWHGTWIAGGLPNSCDWVFVNTDTMGRDEFTVERTL